MLVTIFLAIINNKESKKKATSKMHNKVCNNSLYNPGEIIMNF